MKLKKLFDPHKIAVIGASSQKEKLGYSLLYNLLQNKKRIIYPVNPHHKRILGYKCFNSVLKIKGKIDLALIAVKAEVVPGVLEECGRKKIPFAIIISAGFKETGEKGKRLEEEIKIISQRYEIGILGPNCLGLLDSLSNLNASFASEMILRGDISFLSQSGAICSSMLDWAKKENIGFSKFVSLGNESVLTENDFLEYLKGDKKTKAILMYLEGITDGKRFVKIAKKITRIKPLVILKAGRTEKGKMAIASHTGSLTPSDEIFKAVCRQNKIVNVDSLRELFNFTKIFNAGILKPLSRLAVVTNGGGPSVLISDLIEMSPKLLLAKLNKETKNKLKKFLPGAASINNPVDILGDALSSRYEKTLKVLIEDKNIDGLIVIVTPQKMTEIKETAKVLIKYHKKKPVIPIFIGEQTTAKGEEILKRNKVGNFEYPEDIKEVLEDFAVSSILRKKKILKGEKEKVRVSVLDFNKTFSLLKKYKIEAVPSFFAKQKNELRKIIPRINFPIAIKVVSPQIIHKTDFGGVKLNIRTAKETEEAWEKIVEKINPDPLASGLRPKASEKIKAEILGMIIQPMIKGKEVIVGLKRDPIFGPVIIFGLGGIFTEILKDVSMAIAPLTKKDAREMLGEIKGLEILKGARGERSVNFEALEKIILSLSRLSLEHQEIKEIDLNPVIVNDARAIVVDARIII